MWEMSDHFYCHAGEETDQYGEPASDIVYLLFSRQPVTHSAAYAEPKNSSIAAIQSAAYSRSPEPWEADLLSRDI